MSRPEVTPLELKAHLVEELSLLEADPERQIAWLTETRSNPYELLENLDITWPTWRWRLEENQLLDAETIRRMDILKDAALALWNPQYESILTHSGMRDAPEWRQLRKLAAEAKVALMQVQEKPSTA